MGELFLSVNSQQKEQRVNIRVTKDEKEWIDGLARGKQCNASDIIRDALRVYKETIEGEANVQSK